MSQRYFPNGAVAFILLLSSIAVCHTHRSSVSEGYLTAVEVNRQRPLLQQEQAALRSARIPRAYTRPWQKHVTDGISPSNGIAFSLTTRFRRSMRESWPRRKQYAAEIDTTSGLTWIETPRKRLKRQQNSRSTPVVISPNVICGSNEKEAVFGLDVSTFGPVAGCVADILRCIESKRDSCLSRALLSGDLAMYCPQFRGEAKGNCVEAFLRYRCAVPARSCLRDCRGAVRSRSSFNEECRSGNKGHVCKHFTLFHQQRIATQDICVPSRCDSRTISDGLALYYGTKRLTELSRSLSAQAMDDMVVCGGHKGEPRHVASGNKAVNTFKQTSLPQRDISQAPSHNTSLFSSSSRTDCHHCSLPLALSLLLVVIL